MENYMKKARLAGVFGMVVCAYLLNIPVSHAEQDQNQKIGEMMQKRMQYIDQAIREADMRKKHAAANTTTAVDLEKLKRMDSVDPQELADRFYSKQMPKEEADDELIIFVSTTIPEKTLILLGEQARKVGARMVMRGLIHPLSTPKAFEKTVTALAPVAKTGVNIQIDPAIFKQYNITAVPSFAIGTRSESCESDKCAINDDVLSGDVSLDYALEAWVKKGGKNGNLARQYLAKLSKEIK